MAGYNGRMVPEYTADQARSWLEKMDTYVIDWTNIVVIVVALLGFALFVTGLVRWMRQQSEDANGGMGGASRGGMTMMVIGAAFGCIDILMIAGIALMKPGP